MKQTSSERATSARLLADPSPPVRVRVAYALQSPDLEEIEWLLPSFGALVAALDPAEAVRIGHRVRDLASPGSLADLLALMELHLDERPDELAAVAFAAALAL